MSPHSLRHKFARSYFVNGDDVFSLQHILGPGKASFTFVRHPFWL